MSLDLKKEALQMFDEGYNCAESVYAAGMKHLKMDDGELVPRLATGFGGGISRTKSVCGAFTGLVLVLGAKYGRINLEGDRSVILNKIQTFNEGFVKEFGSNNCYELTGLDFNTPEGMEKYKNRIHRELCERIVAFTAVKLQELL